MAIQVGYILKFIDLKNNIDMDLSVNKVLEPFNSRLILEYCLFDNRFHEIATLLKIWNKYHFPDEGSRLNSYSLTLMLIAFLQK